MKHTTNASAIVQDLHRRGIKPDKIEDVNQGVLLMWQFCNSYVCELRLDTKTTKKQAGDWSISGGCYINTYSAQEIADDLHS